MSAANLRILRAGLPAVLALAFALHGNCQDKGRDRYIKVFLPDGKAVTAELAVTDAERERGLMFREKILPDEAMLFVFGGDEVHSFWMKNTLIPLDMLWLDGEKRVIYIAAGVPPCRGDPCPSYGPEAPSRYVLELKGGEAAEHGLKINDRLQFVLPDWVLKGLSVFPRSI
jgi:uncharacterized membrane protein (UPF0127 family)